MAFAQVTPAKREIRTIQFVGVVECDGWRLKRYNVSASGIKPDEAFVSPETLPQLLLQQRRPTEQYGYGVLIYHHFDARAYLTLLSWERDNVLVPLLWRRSVEASGEWEPIQPKLCQWDTHIQQAEFALWYAHVVEGGDLEGYLNRYIGMETL